MRDLWRKTAQLLRCYPILCVPYLCADFITTCLNWVLKLATKRLFIWSTTARSVLGGETQGYSHPALIKGTLLATVIRAGTYFTNTCLYAAALVLTAVLAGMVLRDQTPNPRAAIEGFRTYPKRILMYALKFFVFCLIVAVVLGLPSIYLLLRVTSYGSATYTAATTALSLLSMLCSAWIMTPIAIRLLRPADSDAVSSEVKNRGRYCAMLLAASTVVLSHLFGLLIGKLTLSSSLQWNGVLALESLVVNSPFILLFIALALIAAEVPLENHEHRLSNFREILKALMPLHFREREEP